MCCPLFPAMFEGIFGESILKKATEKEAVTINVVNFREYADNKHNQVDDYPYGGWSWNGFEAAA